MKKKLLTRKKLLSCVCCTLAAITFCTYAPRPVMEAMYVPEYISELRVFTSDSAAGLDAAIQACRAAGYTPVEQDLNPAEGEKHVVLGYLTTKSRDQAITDVRALYMGLGYEEYSLKDVLEEQKEQMTQIARELMICCGEFRANYEAGSPQALLAYQIFNHFQLDDQPGMPMLGDYLLSDDCMPNPSGEDPKGVAVMANYFNCASVSFTNMLYVTMVSAVADYNPDSQYVQGEYEVEVVVPEAEPSITISPEAASAIAAQLVSQESLTTSTEAVTSSDADVTDETDDSTGDVTAITELTTSAPEPAAGTSVTEADTTALPETSGTTTLTARTDADTTSVMTETTTLADTTEETDDTDETEETTVITTEKLTPNEIVTLVLGCDKRYSTWAERISLTGIADYVKDPDDAALFDSAFQNQALNIRGQVQDFAKRCQEAAARYDVYGDEMFDAARQEIGDTDDVLDLAEQIRRKVSITGEMNESGADLAYLTAYQMLDQYRYDETRTVAQYLVEVGCCAYGSMTELRKLYPLIAAMTDGQVQMVQYNGLLPVVSALANNDDIIKNTREMMESLDRQMIEYNGRTYISVCEGVDSSEQMIGVTDALRAQQTAGAVYETMNEPVAYEKNCDKVINCMSMIMQIGGFFTGALMLGGLVVGKAVTGSMMMIGFGTCWGWITAGGFWVAVGGVAAMACLVVPMVAGVVMLLTMLIKEIVKGVRELLGMDEDPEWQDIPGLVFDFVDNAFVNYHAVKDSGGAYADLNGGTGKRWCALYYTKAPKIGSPLLVPETGPAFCVSYSEVKITGYTPLKEFNSVLAANLDDYVKKSNAPNVYLHFKTEKDVSVPINQGQDADVEDVRYVTGVMISSSENESAAKAAIQKKGYTVYPKNLTPHYCYDNVMGAEESHYLYCYLGYITSDSPANAVTDIRVCRKDTSQAINFGTGGYTNVGTTATGDSVFYTCDKNMGEPITDQFQLVLDPKTAPDGWEPVASFSGFPYDFNGFDGGSTQIGKFHYDHDAYSLYLYYLPSKIYTAQNADGSAAAEYLGGLMICEENTNDKETKKNNNAGYAGTFANKYPGTKVHDYNLIGIAHLCQLVTITTHNPKRAVYGIRGYVAAPKGETLAVCLGVQAAGAFTVCDVHFTRGFTDSAEETGFRSGHAYGFVDAKYDQQKDTPYGKIQKYGLKSQAEDFEKEGYWNAPYSRAGSYISWETCDFRKKGIYLRGYGPDLAPLMMSEVVFTHTPLEAGKTAFAIDGTMIDPKDFSPVQDFKMPNATTPHDLSVQYAPKSKQDKDTYYTFEPSSGAFYIYLKRQPVEKKYISSISVKTYNFDDYIEEAKIDIGKIGKDEMPKINNAGDDMCVMSLLSTCTDEIYPFNIASLNATEFHEDSAFYEDVGHWFANLGRDIGGWVAGFFSDSTENKLERYNYAGDIVDNVRVWQDDLDKYVSNSCTYMGFSRTDNEMEAIRGIIKYKPADGKAPLNIKVDGVTFNRCGGEKDMVHDYLEGDYYIYTTKESGASPGRPISAVTLNTEPITRGAQTARTAYAQKTESKADPDCMNFIHAFYDDTGMYMDAVYLGRGDSKRSALCDLLNMNCCNVIPYNLHDEGREDGKSGDYLYIGITKYQPLTRTDLTERTSAVRDIRIVTEQGFELEKRIDGKRYKRAIDKYSYNKDYTQAICLNDANGAYLYYSASGTDSPLDKIGVGQMDRVPPTENNVQVWENVLTESGVRFNLNDSFITFTEKDSDIVRDNRLYLFARRLDGTVKFGSEIVGGHCDEMMQYGELMYTRQ